MQLEPQVSVLVPWSWQSTVLVDPGAQRVWSSAMQAVRSTNPHPVALQVACLWPGALQRPGRVQLWVTVAPGVQEVPQLEGPQWQAESQVRVSAPPQAQVPNDWLAPLRQREVSVGVQVVCGSHPQPLVEHTNVLLPGTPQYATASVVQDSVFV